MARTFYCRWVYPCLPANSRRRHVVSDAIVRSFLHQLVTVHMNEQDRRFRRTPRPMRVVKEESGRRERRRRTIFLAIATALLVLAVIAFPRLLAFFELAARELRYLWWLVLLVALGGWMAYYFGKKRV